MIDNATFFSIPGTPPGQGRTEIIIKTGTKSLEAPT